MTVVATPREVNPLPRDRLPTSEMVGAPDGGIGFNAIMAPLPTLAEIESIAAHIDAIVPPTPQFEWPLLSARARCELWVKHENHTPIGSFKVRGALQYFADLAQRAPAVRGVIAATRGNYGQAIAFAARLHHIHATIVIPHGNSREKNAAMRAWFTDTHNVAEGAAGAALAAVLQERDRNAGQRIGVMCTGGNVDREVFARVLAAD